MLRSATRDTRRTASTSSEVLTEAVMGVDSGNSERILGYSPSISSEVVRRPPDSKPTSSVLSDRARFSSPAGPRVLATSLSVLALISAAVCSELLLGRQVSSRMARR